MIPAKRKAFMALFNNPYIIKARKRNKVINNNLILKQIKKVKAAD
jgi:hypothetical protein